MTPEQTAMNLDIAALIGDVERNYSTCLNAARKARRACGLGLPRDAVKRNRYLQCLYDVVREDNPDADFYDIGNPSPMQQCRALLRAFGPKVTP